MQHDCTSQIIPFDLRPGRYQNIRLPSSDVTALAVSARRAYQLSSAQARACKRSGRRLRVYGAPKVTAACSQVRLELTTSCHMQCVIHGGGPSVTQPCTAVPQFLQNQRRHTSLATAADRAAQIVAGENYDITFSQSLSCEGAQHKPARLNAVIFVPLPLGGKNGTPQVKSVRRVG